MRPEQALTIYEIRALSDEALNLFDHPANTSQLGSTLAGLHWEADFAFVFFAGEADPEAMDFISRQPDLDLRHIHRLTYAQWQDGAGAEPFTVAGLTIAGPETDGRPASAFRSGQAAEPGIIIDPGLAFGFGGHPTTRTCLEFLYRACRSKPAPRSALDLGAGTGVLSLAAAAWGLERVIGVDYSHLAVEAAQNNLNLNRLGDRVSFFRGPAQNYAGQTADLLLANLHLSLQEELFDLGAFRQRRQVIVSGLLPSEGDQLLVKLRSISLKLLDQVRTDRWITMYLVNDE